MNIFFRYAWRPTATSYNVRVLMSGGSSETVRFPATGEDLDIQQDYFWLFDNSTYDIARIWDACLQASTGTHGAFATTFTAARLLSTTNTGLGNNDFTVEWSSDLTTLDSSLLGAADADLTSTSDTLVSPAMPAGFVFPGQPPSLDTRPQAQHLGSLAEDLAGDVIGDEISDAVADHRRLEFDLLLRSKAMEEYASVTQPYGTMESLWKRAARKGYALHYGESEDALGIFSVLKAKGNTRNHPRRSNRAPATHWFWGSDFNEIVPATTWSNEMSLLLDGSSDRIVCLDSTVLDGITEFSFSCWVKPDASTNNETIIKFVTGTTELFTVRFRSSGALRAGVAYVSNAWAYCTGALTIADGAWGHIHFEYDGGGATPEDRVRLWIDGVEETTGGGAVWTNTPPTSMRTASSGPYMGATNVPNNYFDGALDEMAIWPGLVGIAAETYNAGVPWDLRLLGGGEPAHYWRFGDGGDALPTLTDFGTLEATATVSGGALQTDVP